MPDELSIEDRPDEQRYEARVGGAVAGELGYVRERDEFVIVHTGTEEAYRGHGYAAALVDRAVADAAAEGRRVVAVCPFARNHLAGRGGSTGAVPVATEEP